MGSFTHCGSRWDGIDALHALEPTTMRAITDEAKDYLLAESLDHGLNSTALTVSPLNAA
jgi:hypothetical protein